MTPEFDFAPSFQKKFEKLKPNIKEGVTAALKKFKKNPEAAALRLHRLSDVEPPIWKIDVFPDRSWQIAMIIEGNLCTLLRVGTHKEMDRTY